MDGGHEPSAIPNCVYYLAQDRQAIVVHERFETTFILVVVFMD
jgi:hypothetical protein